MEPKRSRKSNTRFLRRQKLELVNPLHHFGKLGAPLTQQAARPRQQATRLSAKNNRKSQIERAATQNHAAITLLQLSACPLFVARGRQRQPTGPKAQITIAKLLWHPTQHIQSADIRVDKYSFLAP